MIPVTLSRGADSDLDGILDYGIAQHGRVVAEAYLRMIHAAFDRLSDFPELGIARTDPSPDLRGIFRCRRGGPRRGGGEVLDTLILLVGEGPHFPRSPN